MWRQKKLRNERMLVMTIFAVGGAFLSFDMSSLDGINVALKHKIPIRSFDAAMGAFVYSPDNSGNRPAAVFFFNRTGTDDEIVAMCRHDERMRGHWAECRSQVFSRFHTSCLFKSPEDRMAFYSEIELNDGSEGHFD